MVDNVDKIEDLSQEQLARLILDMFHRLIIHHGLWFAEVERQLGPAQALEALRQVFKQSFEIQAARLAQSLGFDMKNGLPAPLLDLPRESLLDLLDSAAKNWLANDGVWFQTVEFSSGMFDAKRANDSCWVRFSPFEADSIKEILGLPKMAGLEGLKKALGFRLYARLNRQSIIDEGPDCFVFQMNECRVQAARQRKGLDDYPCKSAGMVEYPFFARAIDPRIKTECVGCPPDPHPAAWHCAWRFRLGETE